MLKNEKPETRNNIMKIQEPLPKDKVEMITEDVCFYNDNLHVTVTKYAKVVDHWIDETMSIYYRHRLICGLDVEWLTNLNPGEDHPVATLQLCIEHRCLIFQLLHKDSMPSSLRAFLMEKRYFFAGVGVAEDANKLSLHHGLVVSRTIDLNQLAVSVYKNPKFRMIGLKRLASEILRKYMVKPRSITLSNWDAEVLSSQQIEYAAIDAFVSSEICIQLAYATKSSL